MSDSHQLPLFEVESPGRDKEVSVPVTDWGTFKDSMRAPVHSWFRYPAGYSYKFVEMIFDEFDMKPREWVYDPFSGTGTTLVCAKQRGLNAYGVEAHSFVHWVAEVKLHWEYNFRSLGGEVEKLLSEARSFAAAHITDVDTEGEFPELIYKCYHPDDLNELFLLRNFILQQIIDYPLQNLLKLALTDTLRNAAAAGTGWPYIAPNKNTGDKPAKKAVKIFETTARKMVADLMIVGKLPCDAEVHNIHGDSRQRQLLDDQQITLALTSPPYLNNYDYADRTRLETYFWGITKTWKDITQQFRDKLMVAATTQVVRRDYQVDTALSEEIKALAPVVYQTIQSAVLELAALRLTKGGKKDYDLMVALYFNDILPIIQETYRVLQSGGHLCIVIGDSAPYGVHIHTEDLLGKLGLAIGFKSFEYREFRTRGGKWKANPQRHTVSLREGAIILTK